MICVVWRMNVQSNQMEVDIVSSSLTLSRYLSIYLSHTHIHTRYAVSYFLSVCLFVCLPGLGEIMSFASRN